MNKNEKFWFPNKLATHRVVSPRVLNARALYKKLYLAQRVEINFFFQWTCSSTPERSAPPGTWSESQQLVCTLKNNFTSFDDQVRCWIWIIILYLFELNIYAHKKVFLRRVKKMTQVETRDELFILQVNNLLKSTLRGVLI